MVKLRADVDGCGCARCQDIDPDVLRRSVFDALIWGGRVPIARPSILMVFSLVGLAQAIAVVGPRAWLHLGVLAGVLGVFAGRGYVGVLGRGELGPRDVTPLEALWTVLRRIPAFVASVAVVAVSLALVVVVFVAVHPAQAVTEGAGLFPTAAEGTSVVALVAVFVYVLVKLCFLPEACFVGGYGPVESIRVSWTLTTVHRAKAAGLVAGFLGLFAVGVLLDTRLADPNSPVALSFRYRETTVVLRSFGFSAASGLRFVFDLLVTIVYSGVFVHQYVSGVVASSASDTQTPQSDSDSDVDSHARSRFE